MADTVKEVAEKIAVDMETIAEEATDEDNIREAFEEGAEVVMDAGMRNVRAQGLVGETETLSEEWEIRQVSKEARGSQMMVTVGPAQSAFYGLFHEIGAGHNPAKPFLRPAFDENVDRIVKAIGESLEAATDVD